MYTRGMNKSGIIAYGTEEDRRKIAAVAKADGYRSASAWIIAQIRRRYEEVSCTTKT